jgi:hypothetical protein
MSKPGTASWEFTRRFRRGLYGWKSEPAIRGVKRAVSEINKVARRDPVLGAEGAVLFLERVSSALRMLTAPREPSATLSTTPSKLSWPSSPGHL